MYHKTPLDQIFIRFHSRPEGLTEQEVDHAKSTFGPNTLTEKKEHSLIIKFLLQFKNFFSLLLLFGGILSFVGHAFAPNQGNDVIGYALIGVTLLNASFTFFQEYRATQAMKSFQGLLPTKIQALRSGKQIELDAKELVPGDIILLNEGDKVPADARLIEEHMLKVDHSALTGESEPQLRSLEATHEKEVLSRNMVFSGTLVQSGTGKAIIVRTGDDTEIGSIAHMTNSVKSKESNIKRELATFVKLISSIAIVLGVSFFGLGLLIGMSIWQSIVFGIGIIVANVPEGLLPTVTLTLSISAQKLAKKKALVKDIESIETLGSVTVICTDKTGTLTQNKLNVTDLMIGSASYTYNTHHKEFQSEKKVPTLKDSKYKRILECMHFCNNATDTSGDPTEIALQQVVADITTFEGVREHEIPFDSEKKYMITANTVEGKRIAYLKGAPEKVAALCKTKLPKNNFAKDGKRVLAFAYKTLGSKKATEKELEKPEYTFIGYIGMQDPPRTEVAGAVLQCQSAGIRVIIISGDQEDTIQGIAKQTGIGEDIFTITSDKLAKLTDKQLDNMLQKHKSLIFARSLPQDKMRIVQALQRNEEIVAVTGDGVNDAPALKQANVGIAMGSGTSVAQDASNIVLLNDNFATIVHAIKGGRIVFDNIKKFILYILTSNIPEILPFLFMVLLGWPLALPVLLILAIDLGTDVIPSISLGQETAESDVMKKPPRSTKSKLLTSSMLIRSYGIIGPLQALFAFLMFFTVLFRGGWEFGQTIATSNPVYMSAVGAFFATIIITQIFNGYACRSNRMSVFEKGIFANKLYVLGIFIELILLGLILFYPPIERVFGTLPFDLWLLIPMIGFGLIILCIEELRKRITRKTGKLSVE
jgi:sodium/potassium-transporting ATPase subunit alpha